MDGTRKNQVIVTAGTLRARETGVHRRERGQAKKTPAKGGNYSKNHYCRSWNFHTFRNSFGKAFTLPPFTEENARRKTGKEKERGFSLSRALSLCSPFSYQSPFHLPAGPPSSEASKRAGAWAAFRFPYHFAPFSPRTEKRCEKGWLTALIVLVVPRNGLLGFPSGFLQSSLCSPLFFQSLSRSPPRTLAGWPVAVQIIVTARRCWPNSSRNERISLAKLVIRDNRKLSSLLAFSLSLPPLSFSLPLWPRSESNRFDTLFTPLRAGRWYAVAPLIVRPKERSCSGSRNSMTSTVSFCFFSWLSFFLSLLRYQV